MKPAPKPGKKQLKSIDTDQKTAASETKGKNNSALSLGPQDAELGEVEGEQRQLRGDGGELDLGRELPGSEQTERLGKTHKTRKKLSNVYACVRVWQPRGRAAASAPAQEQRAFRQPLIG